MQTATLNHPPLELVQEPAPAAPVATRPQTATVLNPQALIDMAMARGDANLDQLERLLNLQRQWQESEREHQRYLDARDRERQEREAELAFRRAYAAFRGDNIVIPKTKPVDMKRRDGTQGPKFNQAEYDLVVSMLTPSLTKNGFGIRHDPVWGEREVPGDEPGSTVRIGWVKVTCMLDHEAGHTEKIVLEGPQDFNPAVNFTQQMQITTSYLKRQSVLAITGTPTEEEDDESRMQRHRKKGEPEDDADSTVSQMNKATTMQELAKVMSGLSPAEKRNYVAHFNKRSDELKGGSK